MRENRDDPYPHGAFRITQGLPTLALSAFGAMLSFVAGGCPLYCAVLAASLPSIH